MHLKKCTLFLSFCTVFTPKRQSSPPFERKRRDRKKEFFSHIYVVSPPREGALLPPRFHIDSHGRIFLRRDFSRSGEGGVFFSRFHIDSHGRIFFATGRFTIGQGWRVFFRDFTSTATDAFFCDGTFHDRAREEHLASETPCRGGQPFFRSGSFVGRRG